MLKQTMIFVSGVAVGALALGGTYYGVHRSTISADLAASQASTNTIVPLTNASCSGGKVVFTFDGGPLSPPAGGTPLVLSTLRELHATGVFFVLGTAATQNPQLIRQEVADGDLVENHTWDHADFTGRSAGTKPLTAAQIKSELRRGAAAIVAAGAPAPALYRPPFDDITPADNAIAASLGERVVMSYGNPGTEIIDSQDWKAKFTGSQIAHNVIYGYTDESGNWIPGLDTSTGSMTWIIGYHDGLNATVSTPAAESLPIIVQWMNANDMCSTNTVPADATGGVVPNIPVKS
jgi:peptidoglycan/xylan/chitin deacetylase (PgdA/CDA1 family)